MNKNQTVRQLARLTFNLSTVYQNKFYKVADTKGLCPAELKCIRVFGSSGKLSNKETAKRMGLSPSRLTRIIKGCVEKGYMNRGINQKDWRTLSLTLTRKGKSLNHKLDKEFTDAHYSILRGINSAQRKPLINLMEELSEVSSKKLRKHK